MAKEQEILELYIKPQFESIHQKLADIGKAINGNGCGGIKSDVAVAKNNIRALQIWRSWIVVSLSSFTIMGIGLVIRYFLL